MNYTNYADMKDLAAPERSEAGKSIPFLVGLLAYAGILATGTRVLDDPDPYLHIAVGRWIIANLAVPNHDIFSNSLPGAFWVAHEWLAEIVTSWLYDHAGWAGLVVGTAACFAVTMAVLTRSLLRYLQPSHALVAAVAAWALCFPHLFARPHVFSLLLLVLWVSALVAARSEGHSPPYVLSLVMTIWANLHGAYIIGLLLAALLAGEATLQAPDRRARLLEARNWTVFVALSVMAALVTPYGVHGFLMPLDLVRMDSIMSTVAEWKSPSFQQLQPLEFWLMLVLLGALSLGLKLPVTRIAILLLLVHMALAHRRHAEILALVGPLVVAPALGSQLRQHAVAGIDRRLGGLAGLTSRGGMVVAGIVVLALAALVFRTGVVHDSSRFAPTAAITFVEKQRIVGRVFNEYAFGDYLIFAGIAPFVDGRADMYGNAFIERYNNVTELPTLLDRYQITWTLLKPQSPRAALLDHLRGWRRIYVDETAIVHVRESETAER